MFTCCVQELFYHRTYWLVPSVLWLLLTQYSGALVLFLDHGKSTLADR
jgi:hypothetical protein